MKVLFVTPNSYGSGEAITALHMGMQLAQLGHEIRYFADGFTSAFLGAALESRVDEMSDDPRENVTRWHHLLQAYKPRVIVFADYPLLFLSGRWRTLLQPDHGTLLATVDSELITLDHLGMAQGPMTLSFGPPHLELFQSQLPALPERMKVLLPCPVQRPAQVSTARGLPFRYSDPPFALAQARRREIRQRFLSSEDELMVFHSAPSWAVQFCRRHRLPNYAYLTRLFETLLARVPRPVAVVSVNGCSLMLPPSSSRIRVINLGRLRPTEYEELLFSSDLMITDNRVSSSLGKAVCGLIPCVALRNSHRLPELLERADEPTRALLLEMEHHRLGCVFPFEVFPIWSREDLDALGVFSENPFEACVVTLEMYGGEDTRRAFEQLLTDPAYREKLRAQQLHYISLIRRLATSGEALLSLIR